VGSWLRALAMTMLVRAWGTPLDVSPWMLGWLPAIGERRVKPTSSPSIHSIATA
jgi:hypothetical protein